MLSGFELYARWVPLFQELILIKFHFFSFIFYNRVNIM